MSRISAIANSDPMAMAIATTSILAKLAINTALSARVCLCNALSPVFDGAGGFRPPQEFRQFELRLVALQGDPARAAFKLTPVNPIGTMGRHVERARQSREQRIDPRTS